MRKLVCIAGLMAMLFLALPGGWARTRSAARTRPASIDSPATTLVIVFKDGHRQSFNLSDIARVEFPADAVSPAASGPAVAPSRGRFFGRWKVGDGAGRRFFITLEESGDAWRSLHHVHGRWTYVDGEARITWDDSAQDAIRKTASGYQKFAYGAGKSFTDKPDNVTAAQNTTPHPI
jgi:hypothetical protein